MTPRANFNQTDLVSRLTIAALEDVGYKVNYTVASPYGRADVNENCTCDGGRERSLFEEEGPPPTHQHRRISDETYNYGYAWGKEFLAQGAVNAQTGILQVALEIVFVLVQDDFGIHSVVVRADD